MAERGARNSALISSILAMLPGPKAQLSSVEAMLPGPKAACKAAISVFYHATNSTNEASIKRDGQLTQTRSPQDWNAGKDLKGVYFNCNLHKGGLPTQSPHGDRRVRVPIQDIVTDNMHLFFAGFHVSGRNNHVQLILVKRTQSAEYAVCRQNFTELDRTSNAFLLLPKSAVYNQATSYPDDLLWGSTSSCNYQYYDYIKLSFSCWVNIFVVGDVILSAGSRWDGVRCTGRQTYNSFGGRPSTESSDEEDGFYGGMGYDDFGYGDPDSSDDPYDCY